MYTLELIRRVAIAAYSALALLVRPFSVFAWSSVGIRIDTHLAVEHRSTFVIPECVNPC
jgi:hypothetical protein